MIALCNRILAAHNASAVLTRTEEDASWGTQVYVRIACTEETQEQALLELLVKHIKQQACLLRPEIVESQLDGTSDVRMRVPSEQYAKTLAWTWQRERLRRPLLVATGLAVLAIGGMFYLYRASHAPHEPHKPHEPHEPHEPHDEL